MVSLDSLLQAIDELTIAQEVGIPHDEARMRFALNSNTVSDFAGFQEALGAYYNHHFTTCVSRGGTLSPSEARGSAKEIVERDYRRRNGTIVTAFNDAQDGTNGGLRAQLDIIAEGLKALSVERHIREAFDRHVRPSSWEDKVEIIRQFIRQCGPHLASSIRADQPERYAQDYSDLIRAYVNALRQTSSVFRRL